MTVVNYKCIAISLLLFCFTVLWGQEKRLFGYPSSNLKIYKDCKYIGKSRAEILQNLGQPDGISRYDNDQGDDLEYNDGMVVGFRDDNPDSYDVLLMTPNSDGSKNPYTLGGGGWCNLFQIDESFGLLDNYTYNVYTKGSDTPLSKTQENNLPKNAWRQYSFVIQAPDGTLTDVSLDIDVENDKIIRIWVGMAE